MHKPRRAASCISSTLLAAFIALALWGVGPLQAQPLDGTITYQGQLKQAGDPLTAVADFEFRLFDALSAGTQVGGTVPANNVSVADGLFTVPLNFGAAAFNGDQRWLEIAVRSPAGAGAFETLTPRQPLTAAPYALYALSGPSANGPWAANGDDIHNTNPGFVGIGTTTPDTALHVRVDEPVLVLQDANSPPSAPFPYISFRNSASTEMGWMGFNTPGSQALSIVNTQFNGNIRFLTQNIERLTITQNGAVGIGTTTPGADFEVRSAFDRYFRFSLLGATINRADNGTLMQFTVNGVTQGSISVSGGVVSYNGFMGSHYAFIDGDHSIERGSLVSMTGENRRLNDSTEGDAVYGIEPSAQANDPACLGAYLGIMEASKPADLANPHLVAAVGNGEMLVVDSGTGGLRPGDYLIAADVSGCAMKDDPSRFAVGHVVARAAQNVEWSSVAPDQDGRRVVRMSVFFENFVRASTRDPQLLDDPESANLRDAQRTLRAENDGLRARIEALEQVVNATLKDVDR